MSEQDIGNVTQPKPEIRPPEAFSSEEIRDVIDIVDIGPQHVQDIEPENIAGVTKRGLELLEEERKQYASMRPDDSLAGSMGKVADGFSFTHAIQCPANSQTDFAFFEDNFHQFLKDKAIPQDNTDAASIQSFLDSHKTMNSILIDLYVTDIARRYDIAKRDPKFFDAEWPKLRRLLPKLSEQLDRFSSENSQKLEAADPDLRQKIETDTGTIRSSIANPDKAVMRDTLYDNVIKPFSELTFYHFEGLNEKPLRQAIQNLTSR